MRSEPRTRSLSAARISLVYVVVGGAWVGFSDRLLFAIVPQGPLYEVLTTGKGWGFVGASGLLIFWMVSRREGQLEEANARLDDAIRQLRVLHRVLRHNLRNQCNVIRGSADLLSREFGDVDGLRRIQRSTDRLVHISEKSRHLRDVLLADPIPPGPIDVVPLIEARIDAVRAARPEADVRVEVPDEAWVRSTDRLEVALGELVENAVAHNDRETPTLRVSVVDAADPAGEVRIEVADDGPGLPEMERNVIAEGAETPLYHSQGLGLWVAHAILDRSDGRIRIRDDETRGTVVDVTLPAAVPPTSSDR